MNFLELIKKGLNNLYAKYIDKNTEDEILPIFYVAGSQTLPPPLSQEEEEEIIKKLNWTSWNAITYRMKSSSILPQILRPISGNLRVL